VHCFSFVNLNVLSPEQAVTKWNICIEVTIIIIIIIIKLLLNVFVNAHSAPANRLSRAPKIVHVVFMKFAQFLFYVQTAKNVTLSDSLPGCPTLF